MDKTNENKYENLKALTPLITIGAKGLGALFTINVVPDAIPYYLMGSMVWDGGELVNNAIRSGNGKNITEYNFFEKRLLYDLPKYIGRKVGIIKSKKELSSKVE